MNQVDTENAAKSLNVVGKMLFWGSGVLFFAALMMLLSNQKYSWFFFVGPGLIMWLTGCFFRGLAVIIYNQIKNNQLLESLLNQE